MFCPKCSAPVKVTQSLTISRDIDTVLIDKTLYVFASIFNRTLRISDVAVDDSFRCVECNAEYSGDNFGKVMVDDYRGNVVALEDTLLLTVSLKGKPVFSCLVNKNSKERLMQLHEDKEFLYEFAFRFNPNYVAEYVFEFQPLKLAVKQ